VLAAALFVASAVLAPAPGGRASEPPAAGAFLPLGRGAEWVYRTHRDRQYTPVGGAARRDFFLGRSSQRVLERRGTQALPQFRLEEVITERHAAGGPLRTNTILEWWSVGSYGARVHERDETGFGDVEIGANVFDPPLLYLLPDPKPDARWTVGVARAGTLEVALEAQAEAIESVSIAGFLHEGCLKVHYTGPLTGTIEQAEGGRLEVKKGSIERYAWWKPGIGIVQDVISMRADVKLPDGKEGEIAELLSKRLEHHVPRR
jgi:hypothetical protein